MSERAQPAEPEVVTAQVEMNLAGTQVQFTLTVPRAPVPPGSILPILHMLSEAVQNGVAEALESGGKRISCRAGCGACCRQLVPITEIEARRLAELVESLPEPRRTEIRARFDAAVRRLDEAGLLERLRHPERVPREERESLGLAYFALGIPCPFLEEESCSIHADRPLVCREFLVTSPPEFCADPAGRRVEGVELPGPSFECPGPAGGSGDPGAQAARRASPRAGVGGGPARGGPHASRARVGLAPVRSAFRGRDARAAGHLKDTLEEAEMDAEEFVRRIAEGEKRFVDLELSDAALPGLNLRQVCLRGAKLSRLDLRGADLTLADLESSCLVQANLRGAHLFGVNLAHARLAGVVLSGASLHGARGPGADLSGVQLRAAHLTRADFRGAILRGADLQGANLTPGGPSRRRPAAGEPRGGDPPGR